MILWLWLWPVRILLTPLNIALLISVPLGWLNRSLFDAYWRVARSLGYED